jgi:GNAT superfamily N-acetyltransferase
VVLRDGTPADVDAAVALWLASSAARRGARPPFPPAAEASVRASLAAPDAFLVIAEDAGTMTGMALGVQGLADDGAGAPIAGLCHVRMVFVAPGRWGQGIGGALVDRLLVESRARGYLRAQLWTHADNVGAQRLYERRGFRRSGREKADDLDGTIVHYERGL